MGCKLSHATNLYITLNGMYSDVKTSQYNAVRARINFFPIIR